MNTKKLDFTGNIHFLWEIFIVFHIFHALQSGKCGKLVFVQTTQNLKNQEVFEKSKGTEMEVSVERY